MLALAFGFIAYYNYRKYKQQEINVSQSIYKLTRGETIDAGNQWWYKSVPGSVKAEINLYYRMPEREFDTLYRMRSAFISGVFDHDKEILFPETKNGIKGYKVITPLYYFDQIYLNNFKAAAFQDGTDTLKYDSERAAMAVHRGW